MPLALDQDIPRLEVAVDDAGLVGVMDGLGDVAIRAAARRR